MCNNKYKEIALGEMTVASVTMIAMKQVPGRGGVEGDAVECGCFFQNQALKSTKKACKNKNKLLHAIFNKYLSLIEAIITLKKENTLPI
jgi:hypothetical protein